MNAPTPRSRERAESFEVTELRALGKRHPELAPAVDLQIELLEIQRRVLPRICLPTTLPVAALAGVSPTRALLKWELIPIEWTAFRGVLRETTDALLRSGNIEAADALFLTGLARDGDRLRSFVEAWFRDRLDDAPTYVVELADPADLERLKDVALDNVLSLAFRPFFARCAEALAPRLSLQAWQRGSCPLCHGEPELSIQSRTQHRLLVCGRCSMRWPFSDEHCAFCDNADPDRLPKFTGPDRVYWLLGCDVCRRYLKAIDERRAGRPALPVVDAIATLPLDALAIQRGYLG